ncbi:MAG TPA: TIGR01777 family oxidoreductase [Terriglobales bacterium]|nr:TIGR01777 family oxidoreductase [Terriglobales bacterium]
MKILASGMSGTIGLALLPALASERHTIVRLKTGVARSQNEIAWDPGKPLNPELIGGFDAVIHLAGENIFGRWSQAKKTRIRDSRVKGTQHVCEALAHGENKPGVLIAGSAIGYYGNRGDETLTEESALGKGFLAETCREWEAATQPAEQAGWRVIHLRTGVVLSTREGALKKMLLPFRLGLGGKIGSGRQWLSWISIADTVAAILHCLKTESLRGPVNMVAPNPVTNAEFSRTLGKALHRPTFATVPAFATKFLFGPEMAEETVLTSQRVLPKRLLESGFQFQQPDLSGALKKLLQKQQ